MSFLSCFWSLLLSRNCFKANSATWYFFSSAPVGSVAEEARSMAEEVFTNFFPLFPFTLHFQNVLVCIH